MRGIRPNFSASGWAITLLAVLGLSVPAGLALRAAATSDGEVSRRGGGGQHHGG